MTICYPGDISWATYLDQACEDFRLIDSIARQKNYFQGNHDYWWTTKSKLEKFLSCQWLSTIRFMHNNSYHVENAVICGTRGWNMPGEDGFNAED